MSAFKSAVRNLQLLIVRIPLILKTLLLHGLHMSPVSGKQDLRTEFITALIRSFITTSEPMIKMQKGSMRDPGIKGPMWVSKVTLPQPEFDVRDAVARAIKDLGTGNETFDLPGVIAVEAEWTGYRSGVDKKATLPDISEEEKYQELRKEVKSDITILYLHGGGYFLMDPCSHRVPVAHLCKRTGAQALSVRYRLAPQNPFPAALVDALTAYLSLIHPPPGSLHEPVPANKIVIAGDSAGGNLTLALLQTLLTLKRADHKIRFHGKEVSIDLPAGAAGISPWCDISRSMPSIVDNAKYDYLDIRLQKTQLTGAAEELDTTIPFAPMPFPSDDAWPVTPPRVDIFCNSSMMQHPIASPLTASPDLWKDSPPVFISVGEESLTDDGLITARRVHQSGTPIVAQMFEGMPHCHGMIMIDTAAGRKFFDAYASFITDAVAGRIKSTGTLTHYGVGLRPVREIPLEEACNVSDEEVEERLKTTARWRLKREDELRAEWQQRAKL